MAVASKPRPATSPAGGTRGGFINFLRGVWDELRKTVWPTPAELYRYTLVVIFTVVVIGLFIGAADLLAHAAAAKWLYAAPQ